MPVPLCIHVYVLYSFDCFSYKKNIKYFNFFIKSQIFIFLVQAEF